MIDDYYEILQLSENVSEEVLNAVYKKLVCKYDNNPLFTRKLEEIKQAYNVLNDSAKRKKYDEVREKHSTNAENSLLEKVKRQVLVSEKQNSKLISRIDEMLDKSHDLNEIKLIIENTNTIKMKQSVEQINSESLKLDASARAELSPYIISFQQSVELLVKKKENLEIYYQKLQKENFNDEKVFCTNCGKQITSSMKFCKYCGHQNKYQK